jgi:hypothetical protein
MKTLTPYPKKLEIRDGKEYSLTAETGFSAYQEMTSNGGLLLLVPELNFFPVVRDRIDGRRETYSDLVLSEPNADLFVPPPGVAVESVAPRAASQGGSQR